MLFPERRNAIGQVTGGLKFAAADGYNALKIFVLVQKIPFGFVRQRKNLLRPALEDHAVLCQQDVVIAAYKQLDAELLFQLCDLP